ncbi:ABC transporter permease [Halomarina oriensis]|uniref:ABC transporter permease subunit n=1 Tax=Halomarina oriensis TaxID=671145 RepID=A0A6B0GJ16_9EURY|nr:ABC transporter permease [Halomarina oriensis]MWG34754.1 ABC transporter permease subunit [Halomarina oriensis]
MSTQHQYEDVPLRERIAANPQPAALWAVGLVVLLLLQLGAIVSTLGTALELFASVIIGAFHGTPSGISPASNVAGAGVVAALNGLEQFGRSLPTLLSREFIPNQGHATTEGGWDGTFLGLPPAFAWAFRVFLIYAYMFFFLWWLWFGYRTFVSHYRQADWTPRDDVVRRLRTHRWGQFGLVIVVLFVGLGLFAPTVSPVTYDEDVINPLEYEVEYLDDSGEVQTILSADANLQSASRGNPSSNVGPLSYDDFGRFHPFGTMNNPGGDLFTFMAYGARVSLFIGLIAMGISGFIAAFFGLLTAYYKGLSDLAVVVVSDSIQAIPVFLLVILVSVVFQGHWLAEFYDGGLLFALVFGLLYWPGLWRAVRGPAFQVSEQEWVDAARSYGQGSITTMRKHMLPYILGYLLIYGSLMIGGIIISVSALSFLGIGISPPTPEWGRAVADGRGYVTTASWHIAFIPGILIVLVVTALNALGDGIRDGIDPQSESGESGASEAAAAGGGG